MRRKIVSIFLVGVLIMIMTMPLVFAQTAQEEKEKLENQLSDTKEEKEEIAEQKNTILGEISKLNDQISEYESQIKELNTKINNLEKSIEANEKEIKKLEKEYEEKEEAFVERIVALYEAGQTTYLDVLLSSDSVVSFISNYYMISELADADKAMMDSIQAQQTKIENAKQELENEKTEIAASRNEVEAKTKTLNTAKASKQSKVNSLTQQEKELQAQIEEYESDLKSVEKQIKEYEEKQNQQSNNNGGSSNTPKYTGGKLGWPVEGYYSITSYYGYRIHPIYGDYRLHTGIDIGAPKNAKFVAAADGIVISASYSGGYGNRVIVSHGNGLTTLYAHGTSILVSVGQTVSKGQAVLTVGSTGASTGNHAHFEVRVNGEYVNPLSYLQ